LLQAIDMHTHILTGDKAKMRPDPNVPRNTEGWGHSPDEMAEMYQKHSMMAVIFDVDQETRTGVKISNVETAAWVRKYPDTFIGFGSVDPRKDAAVQEVNHCADLGLRGMKFQQATQAFCPTDPRFFPIYEACSRLNLAVLFHTGTTAIAAGKPGGGGFMLEYCRPIPYVDEIAARYPELRIIMAHPAWPWHDEQLAVVRHKGNVYMDLSGWAPKYFPPSVIQYANTLIQDKVFFGSDFPVLTPARWLREFAELPIKDQVRSKILLHNAAKFLGMELPASSPTNA